MSRWDWYDGPYFPPSRPRQAKGGIRAQSRRGAFGQKWWAKRWIDVLEGFNIGARLQRGRRYARGGQVLSVDIRKGSISASVQGSMPTPYAVKIAVKPLSEKHWAKVAEVVSEQAVFASKLLGGEMPNEIEETFRSADVPLFPERYSDFTTDCSCPDWSNPCKHIAAVCYLLGEEFDRDPFLIFKLRGIDREEFLALLGERVPSQEAQPAALEPEPLPADPSEFWKTGSIPSDLAGDSETAAAGASLPRRLGKFPFWRGSDDLFSFLDGVYSRASASLATAAEKAAPPEPASQTSRRSR